MADNLKERIAEMKATAQEAHDSYNDADWFTVSTLQRPECRIGVIDCKFIHASSPANVLALIAEIERLQDFVQTVSLPNAQLIDRIRLWSKCPDGYPLDEYVNNIATKLERLEREVKGGNGHGR